MCPAFRLDIALSHLLEPVVSDGGRGVQARFKIARLDQVPLALGGPEIEDEGTQSMDKIASIQAYAVKPTEE